MRAAFLGKLPGRDHSWAIEKTSWDVPRWDLAEEPDALRISTGELEVVAHRSPLQIEFRDAKTHQAVNADQQPMRKLAEIARSGSDAPRGVEPGSVLQAK